MSVVRRALEIAAEESKSTVDQLLGYRRGCLEPRQIAMFLARAETAFSYAHLGRLFNRNWTTVCHNCRRIEQRIARSPEFSARIEALRDRLRQDRPATPVAEIIESRMAEIMDRLRQRLAADPLGTLQLIDEVLNFTRGEKVYGRDG